MTTPKRPGKPSAMTSTPEPGVARESVWLVYEQFNEFILAIYSNREAAEAHARSDPDANPKVFEWQVRDCFEPDKRAWQ